MVNQELPEGTYIELVRSLFSTLLPTSIMTISFVAVGLLVTSQTPDNLLTFLIGIGSIAAAARLAVLLIHRKRAADENLDLASAQILERRFALVYFTFACVLGAFGSRAFVVATAESHMLIIGLLFGYGAGVAAGLSLRPWISVPSILIAIVPTIITALSTADITYRATGLLLAVFLGGGVESMLSRYRSETRKITMRRLFSTLARRDDLTGLPNRLSLRERFEEFAAQAGSGDMIAVHCLDLDKFKPVNDRYGHPVGDALLKAVSERLGGLLRRTDFAARMGGDEFIIVQTGIQHSDEADMLARRIVRSIAQPYSIEGHEITIGTSVGYALSPRHGNDLDRLVACADTALCEVKQGGGGIASFYEPLPEAELRLTAGG
jgi:diguanylate cyclase (GGDEF)-like protein